MRSKQEVNQEVRKTKIPSVIIALIALIALIVVFEVVPNRLFSKTLSGALVGGKNQTTASVRSLNQKVACFASPQVDKDLSNDSEFGASKSKTDVRTYTAAAGQVSNSSLSGLTNSKKNGKVYSQTADNSATNLTTGYGTQTDAQVFETHFVDSEINKTLGFTVGAKFSSTPDGDLKGQAVSNCSQSGTDFWFIGGSTDQKEDTTELHLLNSSSARSEVNISVWGDKPDKNGLADDGSMKYIGDRQVGVNGNSENSILLTGGAADQDVLAIHVQTNYAPVLATVFQRSLDGLTPMGLDYVSRSDLASSEQISGIQVDDPSDISGVLNVLVPNMEKDTETVDITFSKVGGEDQVKKSIDVKKSKISTLDLKFLDSGIWVADLKSKSDEKLISSVKLTMGQNSGGDQEFTFLPGRVDLGSEILAIGEDSSAKVIISSSSSSELGVHYTAYAKNGDFLFGKDVKVSDKKPISLNRDQLTKDDDSAAFIVIDNATDASDSSKGNSEAKVNLVALFSESGYLSNSAPEIGINEATEYSFGTTSVR
ncbi:MAG: DUF5719 family protein [Candidatus Ancillula sp.]|jgi:hypothetical protein|nr:DUF5719 family protein [Candidatus Ancillula sp.]